jgi:hypothetical protein
MLESDVRVIDNAKVRVRLTVGPVAIEVACVYFEFIVKKQLVKDKWHFFDRL